MHAGMTAMNNNAPTSDSPEEHLANLMRLAFWRGRRMSTATVLYTQAAAEATGLNVSDLLALGILHGAGPITAGQLAILTGLTSGAVTSLIDRLESQNYVRRESDPQDRRRVLIVLTEHPPIETAPPFQAMLSRMRQLYQTLTPEQLETHIHLLEEITIILREETENLRENP
jgi:DNA-binding MarR family transcriptional regulator